MDETATTLRIWCHQCNASTAGSLNSTSDPSCSICGSTFVEVESQGIEDFRLGLEHNTSVTSSNDTSSSSNANDSDNTGANFDAASSSENENGSRSHEQQQFRHLLQLLRSTGIPLSDNSETENQMSDSDHNNQDSGDNTVRSVRSIGRINPLFNLITSIAAMSTASDETRESSQFEQFLHHILTNEISSPGVPPSSDELVANLPRIKVETQADIVSCGECAISQEYFELGETAIRLKCNHTFKEELISQWLKMHGTCPTCRLVVE